MLKRGENQCMQRPARKTFDQTKENRKREKQVKETKENGVKRILEKQKKGKIIER